MHFLGSTSVSATMWFERFVEAFEIGMSAFTTAYGSPKTGKAPQVPNYGKRTLV